MKKSLRFSAFVLSLLALLTTSPEMPSAAAQDSTISSQPTLIAFANTHRRAVYSPKKATRSASTRATSTRRTTSQTRRVATRTTVRTSKVARGNSRRPAVATRNARSSHRAVAHQAPRKSSNRYRTAGRKYQKISTAKPKPKYAYASDFFMYLPPCTPPESLTKKEKSAVRRSFICGSAKDYNPAQLVAAGIFDNSEPLRGGIFNRRDTIKYIILHSTETERPAPGDRVIRSWNRGMRHPGAQFVVERNGKIYQTVDPSYGTVHVDIFRTVTGINNDNSIGIEIVRAGKQKYTATQLDSITRLVTYLQSHYNVGDAQVLGHGQVQPSDRTDPVNFNWLAFQAARSTLRTEALNSSGKHVRTALYVDEKLPSQEDGERIGVDKPQSYTKAGDINIFRRWTLRFCQALLS